MCSGFAVFLVDSVSEVKEGEVRCRTGHEGTEGESRYNPTLSLTSALDGNG